MQYSPWEHETSLFWTSLCRSRFPLCCAYGSQMHVPGPSQEMRLAYSIVAWAAPELPLYTHYRCMYTFDGVLGCQRGPRAIEWEVTFRVLWEETNTHTVHSSLQAYLPESTNRPPGVSLISTAVGTIRSCRVVELSSLIRKGSAVVAETLGAAPIGFKLCLYQRQTFT